MDEEVEYAPETRKRDFHDDDEYEGEKVHKKRTVSPPHLTLTTVTHTHVETRRPTRDKAMSVLALLADESLTTDFAGSKGERK